MSERISVQGYQVADNLYNFINNEVLPNTGIAQEQFWLSLSRIFNEFIPINKAVLAKRDEFQAQIDQWHKAQQGQKFSQQAYQAFLTEIGYVVPEVDDFAISTEKVDAEVATIAGPQLVVPLMNARFALNAANARWGSLYDALYGRYQFTLSTRQPS